MRKNTILPFQRYIVGFGSVEMAYDIYRNLHENTGPEE